MSPEARRANEWEDLFLIPIVYSENNGLILSTFDTDFCPFVVSNQRIWLPEGDYTE